MLKTLLVYIHLIAACLAIGVLLVQNVVLIKSRGRALGVELSDKLQHNSALAMLALIALWLSGLVIVAMGYLDNPAYLLNQKLWGKFTVVGILTINGLLLQRYSFSVLTSPTGFISTRRKTQLLVLITLVVSLVSWLYSCYLGIARPWNNVAPYGYVMLVYAVVMLLTLAVAMMLWREWRNAFRLVAR